MFKPFAAVTVSLVLSVGQSGPLCLSGAFRMYDSAGAAHIESKKFGEAFMPALQIASAVAVAIFVIATGGDQKGE